MSNEIKFGNDELNKKNINKHSESKRHIGS